MTEEDQPTVTELIEKITEQNARIEQYELKLKEFEDSINERDKAITSKDEEISKLQKILAKNYVASYDKPKDDIKQMSFSDAYKQAIKDNMQK